MKLFREKVFCKRCGYFEAFDIDPDNLSLANCTYKRTHEYNSHWYDGKKPKPTKEMYGFCAINNKYHHCRYYVEKKK